jgi:hypothetical protein
MSTYETNILRAHQIYIYIYTMIRIPLISRTRKKTIASAVIGESHTELQALSGGTQEIIAQSTR